MYARPIVKIFGCLLPCLILFPLLQTGCGKPRLYSADSIAKQIDDRVARSGEHSIAISFSFSPSEKQSIIDYLILLQKTTGKKYEQSSFDLLLTKLGLVVKKQKQKTLDVYVVNQTHIEILMDEAMKFAKKRDAATSNRAKEEQNKIVREIWNEVDVLRGMLPESNRLSNNAHNSTEKERLDRIERERKTRSLF